MFGPLIGATRSEFFCKVCVEVDFFLFGKKSRPIKSLRAQNFFVKFAACSEIFLQTCLVLGNFLKNSARAQGFFYKTLTP